MQKCQIITFGILSDYIININNNLIKQHTKYCINYGIKH